MKIFEPVRNVLKGLRRKGSHLPGPAQIWEQFRAFDRRAAVLGGAGFLCAFFLMLLWPRTTSVEQPIRFNHQKHLGAGLQCADCHTLYRGSQWAGLPEPELCLMCHAEPLSASPEEEKLRELASQGQPFHWKPVNQIPTHVYFSHQTHTVTREIACAVCHGPMEEATAPPSTPFYSWTMDACMNCHAQQNATLDCNGCHR